MATYYVCAAVGSDSNNGLGPDASAVSNKPFKTLGKCIAAAGAAAAGDTVYVGPGTQRETITIGITPASNVNVFGDPGNTQGFKDSGGNLVPAGEVIVSAFTTDDKTAQGAAATFKLNGKSNFTFQYLVVDSGNLAANGNCFDGATVTGSAGISILDCALRGQRNQPFIGLTATVDTAANWTIDRCKFLGTGVAFNIILPTSTVADYDIVTIIRNCTAIGPASFVVVGASGANAFKGGGITVRDCVQPSCNSAGVQTTSANISTTKTVNVYNCAFIGSGTALSANTTGQIVEDFNILFTTTARTNVTAGKSSITIGTYAPGWEIGQAEFQGRSLRPFMSPAPNSPLLGFGAGGTGVTYDTWNRLRPAGGGTTNTNVDSGTASAGGASTLTDGSKSWTTNVYGPSAGPPPKQGQIVHLTGGTGSGQYRAIQSNTATVLTVTQAWGTNPDNTSTYEIINPGKLQAIGPYERHEIAGSGGAANVDGATGDCWMQVGPGDDLLYIDVDAVSTTISIKCKYDANYGTGIGRPQVILLDQSEIGVTTQTVTATTSANGAYETETLAAITPTAAGVVTLKLISRDSVGYGKVYWDTVSIT